MAASASDKRAKVLADYGKCWDKVKKKQYDGAIKAIDAFRTKYPDQLECLSNLETLERICTSAKTPAVKASSDCVPEELYSSGVVEHNLGNYDEALTYFEEALKQWKSDSDAVHFAMATTYAGKGDNAKALQHLEKSIELNSDNMSLAKKDPDLTSILALEEAQELFDAQPA